MKKYLQQFNNKLKISHNMHKGFVALFAVLLSMVILAMAVGISAISYKEVLLSSSAREGHYAFFAADAGIECALYGDIQKVVFPDDPTLPTGAFDCIGSTGSGAVDIIPEGGSDPIYSFQLNFGATASVGGAVPVPARCANVEVNKNYVDPSDGTSYTKIDSFGYNTTCDEVDIIKNGTNNPRVVERALRVVYPN